MALKIWVTQPMNLFDSFYYYDTDTKDFVRIRLELNRTGNDPEPGIFAKRNRYIGFVDSIEGLDLDDLTRWSVNTEHKIIYNNTVLDNEPAVGKKVIDFSLPTGKAHPTFVAHGHTVITMPYRLPINSQGQPVTFDMLNTIVDYVIGTNNTILFCNADASAFELADAIFHEYGQVIPLQDERFRIRSGRIQDMY